jgi:glutaredoxin 3
MLDLVRSIRIYTTNYCGYCHAAKALLSRKNVPFEEVDCSEDRETRRWLVEVTGRRTVPQIFIGGVPIGGFDELRRLERDGRLDGVLAGEAEAPSVV